MARFALYLTGNRTPIEVDLEANSAAELADLAARSKFIVGHMAEADADGICPSVLIATSRVQLAVER